MGDIIDFATTTNARSVITTLSHDSATTDEDGTAVCPTTATYTSSTYTALGRDVSTSNLDITAG